MPGKQILFGISIFLLLISLFGIPTAVISNPWFTRMTPVTFVDYFFLVTTSGLLALYVALPTPTKHATATAGGISNAFAVSCPLCNKLFVALLGASAVIHYIEPLRVWFGAVGVMLAGVAAWTKVKRCKTCKGE